MTANHTLRATTVRQAKVGVMSSHRISRRQAIGTLGAAGLAGVVSMPDAGASTGADTSGDAVVTRPAFATVGEVVDIGPDRFTLRDGTRSLVVVPRPDASLYSGCVGRIKDVSGLVVGDRVLVEGKPAADGTISASAVGSVYSNVKLQVESVATDRRTARTSRGTFRLTGRLPDRGRPTAALPLGTPITATIWVDPRDKAGYLLLAGTT
jgi:hypothetical protein